MTGVYWLNKRAFCTDPARGEGGIFPGSKNILHCCIVFTTFYLIKIDWVYHSIGVLSVLTACVPKQKIVQSRVAVGVRLPLTGALFMSIMFLRRLMPGLF